MEKLYKEDSLHKACVFIGCSTKSYINLNFATLYNLIMETVLSIESSLI